MKTLFPKQQESVDFILRALTDHRCALDSSHTGVGKTVIACRVAKEFKQFVAVVCPKIVIPHWERELREVGIVPIFVTNYEKLKLGTQYITKIGKKIFRWHLPPDTLIIWDECHKCKSPFSLNSQMLVSAKQAGYHNLLLSATACQDPTEMRSLGFALGLHSLNKADGKLKSWPSWMMQYGCRKDQWHNWVAGPIAKLVPLNKELYTRNCVKLVPSDLPSAFTDNHVITEPLEFSSRFYIDRYYDDLELTGEIIDELLEKGRLSSHVLVEILRARQLAEVAKVPDISGMIKDACAEGFSVAVFVNFVDTVKLLSNLFKDASVIVGGQSATVREDNVQRFQTNQTNVIICNIAAGGVGVSLHDTEGGHPRMSLISPTFNVKDYIQTLGRIHRANAKSPAIQRVLVTSQTIEEKIVDKLEQKRLSLDTLHAKPEPQ
jgi:superfamily II DNA or RNA helicase